MTKIEDCKVCADVECNEVFVEGQECPACTSKQWFWLATVLNREEVTRDANKV